MASDPIAGALASIPGGFRHKPTHGYISFRTFTSLGVPPGLYTSAALIPILTLILVFFGSAVICFTYVILMFFHGARAVGMSSSIALVGGTILKSISARRKASDKKSVSQD